MSPRTPSRGFPNLTQRFGRVRLSNRKFACVAVPTVSCVPCARNLSVSHIFYPLVCLPTLRADKTAYPHFNIYPSWIRTLVLPAQDVLRPKKARKSYKELHDEVAPRLPTAILDDTEGPTATDGVSRRPLRLTIPVKQRGPAEKLSLSSVPQVSLVLKRVYSLNQINGRNPSPSRPRVSPVFDSFPSIETRLSQPSDTVPVALTRSQSSPTQPPTPKRRQSALIAQRIKALNATLESPEPASDRPARGLTRSLPTPFTRAWSG